MRRTVRDTVAASIILVVSLQRVVRRRVREVEERRLLQSCDLFQSAFVYMNYNLNLFGSQIHGDLIGASQWRIYQGVAKEFGPATSDSFP